MTDTVSQDWIANARAVKIESEIARRGIKLQRASKTELVGPCPVCGGTDRFSVNTKKQVFNCRGCSKAGDVIAMTQYFDSSTFDAAVTTLAGEAPQPTTKSAAKANGSKRSTTAGEKPELFATYDYTDAFDRLHFQVQRLQYPSGGKTFRQRRPYLDEQGAWIWSLGDDTYMRKGPGQHWFRFDEEGWSRLPATKERKEFPAIVAGIPYRLPDLVEAISLDHTVYIVEGEGKVDALAKWGLSATCNAGGAGKWTAEHAVHLRDARVVILPDNDDAGRKHANAVARSLRGIASHIRILELPDLPPKGDIIDWQNAGHTREQFDTLVEQQAKDEQPRKEKPAVANRATSAKELNTMRFNPIKFVVPGIIVEGLTLLAAKPKMGKSWMMLHAAAAVARGGFTLGEIHCKEGDVLYCALEDNMRRLQSRMTKLLGTTQEWPARLFFRCEMPRLTEGGLQEIKDWIQAADHPRLVIIDTLAMVRAPKKLIESSYDADYNAVKELRALANELGIAIVLVHHLRKQEADDPFDTISGTLGLTGAPDTIIVLRRDNSGNIILHGRGRDLVEIEKAMTFNLDACTWTIAGDPREVRASNARKAILTAMRDIALPASPTDIADAASMSSGNVKKLLAKILDDGTVKKCDYGQYDLETAQDTLQ